MAEDCVRIVTMSESTSDGGEKYEIYEAGSNMFCVIGLDNKATAVRTAPAKTRYKQSYREVWESMKDFKGWLSSVPGNNAKAYCKLCKKELHCHRLSLLKHKVTYKHQKREEEQKLLRSSVERNKNESSPNIEQLDNADNEEEEDAEDNESSGAALEGSDLDECTVMSEVRTSDTGDEVSQDNEVEMSNHDGPLSTHVLDLTKGLPGASVHVVLYKLIEGRWTLIHEGLTNTNGRYDQFVSSDDFTIGRYKLHFDVDKYFADQNQDTIFPFVEAEACLLSQPELWDYEHYIVREADCKSHLYGACCCKFRTCSTTVQQIAFDVKDASSRYHIPLLLSPYGYSTYRGS